MASQADLSKLKVVDLKAQLQDAGLSTKGLKAELVDRLFEHLNQGNGTSVAAGEAQPAAAAAPEAEASVLPVQPEEKKVEAIVPSPEIPPAVEVTPSALHVEKSIPAVEKEEEKPPATAANVAVESTLPIIEIVPEAVKPAVKEEEVVAAPPIVEKEKEEEAAPPTEPMEVTPASIPPPAAEQPFPKKEAPATVPMEMATEKRKEPEPSVSTTTVPTTEKKEVGQVAKKARVEENTTEEPLTAEETVVSPPSSSSLSTTKAEDESTKSAMEEVPATSTAAPAVEEKIQVQSFEKEEEATSGEKMEVVESGMEKDVPSAPATSAEGVSPSKEKGCEVYVNGLTYETTEDDLRILFSTIGKVTDIRIKKNTNSSRVYAFVKYTSRAAAKEAISKLNGETLRGKTLQVDATSENDRLRIFNIPYEWDQSRIKSCLVDAGMDNIYNIEMATDNNGKSRGFCTVEFEDHPAANKAFKLAQNRDIRMNDRLIRVEWPKGSRDAAGNSDAIKNIFISGVPENVQEEELREIFLPFGEIEVIKLAGQSSMAKRKDFAFINYASRDSAVRAIEALRVNKANIRGYTLDVEMARPRRTDRSGYGGGNRNDYSSRSSYNAGGGSSSRYQRRDYDEGGYVSQEGGYRDRDGGYRDGGYRDGGYRDGGYREGGYRGQDRDRSPVREPSYDDYRRGY